MAKSMLTVDIKVSEIEEFKDLLLVITENYNSLPVAVQVAIDNFAERIGDNK